MKLRFDILYSLPSYVEALMMTTHSFPNYGCQPVLKVEVPMH